ncbi:5-carboxymethyl-2-hydroxymuconate Delta-isomerase [Ensifer adhaerens]|uniref:5-carboxymethyl-2-hydroxymuconate Delta-isomerase n=1 Tax=Ensifer adhaerens TaxID=106592 RepID=UPI001CBF1B1C|nr:5-carboxymethyl-2-hydroxymuconate Delta-isomerase [Ensifer adhaerens]MBZ7926818.1 5-carboxymethyl-2-hydroxymuconate Delta-isomerase [Ensifer adhaerens]UAX96867.1 5-carboxymethyl-2-hydroxymuconate Delta-isomerase [Ensifer adhaerens]UAY03789.1 5-carboxymethyl-2-hydroxymuconate Delta-isomerase [Ensifer adhaerens]UAY11773.1 5-carboxymethyl-2-hydroxymuconate Delta-isomerase [Ensifer adhaerens]
MPHLTIEYSGNLDGHVDFAKLCRTVHASILGTGLFELGAVRVRTIQSRDYAVADLLPENGFIDMSFRIGRGRTEAEKKSTGDAIFQAVSDELSELFATPHFALSLEIREIDPDLSWKKNAIHPRLRAAKG